MWAWKHWSGIGRNRGEITSLIAADVRTALRNPRRLAALDELGLVETSTSPAFDRLTHLAARILNAPVALVSLVTDERQCFVSAIGLPEPWATTRTIPLSHSFCQYTVATQAPFIVDDAYHHPLVKDNLAIEDLGVVAYAGIPLMSADQAVLGALSVIDHVPRTWTDQEITLLTDLAAAVESELALHRELAARTRAEQSLQAREMDLRLILEHVQDHAIVKLDRDGLVTSWNSGAERITRYQADQIIGTSASRFYPPELRDQFPVLLRRAAAEGRVAPEGWRLRADGSWFWAAVVISAMYDGASDLQGFVKVTRDISTRRQAESALRASEMRLAGIIDSAMDAIITVDDQQRIQLFNRAAEELFHCSSPDVIGQSLDRFIPERYRASHRSHIPKFGNTGITTRSMQAPGALMALRSDGTEFPIEASISQINVAGERLYTVILRDITVRKQLEAQLRQAQKMEGIGQLAGGIAHDFNNLLMAILGYTDLVLQQIEPDSEVQEDLVEIQQAAQRAASLTQQLLAFSRQQIIEPHVLDINDLILNVEKLLRRLLGADVELTTRLAPNPLLVKVDPNQIEQVLMNLAINARDAMPHGGSLTVETSHVVIDDRETDTHGELAAGSFVCVAVHDTGIGMNELVKQHVFEPFFNTKAVGQGTGLGLATCLGIVQQHNGHIVCESAVGKGTTFRIYLPQASENHDIVLADETPSSLPVGTETILAVDDELPIRRLIGRILRAYGYTVITAANGMEAIQTFRQYPQIDLLVTDISMPQISGRMLVEYLRQLRPSLDVIYISGYAVDNQYSQNVTEFDGVYLQKPFTPDMLVHAVREALDAGKRSGELPQGFNPAL